MVVTEVLFQSSHCTLVCDTGESLIVSFDFIEKCVKQVCNENGVPEPDRQEHKTYVVVGHNGQLMP